MVMTKPAPGMGDARLLFPLSVPPAAADVPVGPVTMMGGALTAGGRPIGMGACGLPSGEAIGDAPGVVFFESEPPAVDGTDDPPPCTAPAASPFSLFGGESGSDGVIGAGVAVPELLSIIEGTASPPAALSLTSSGSAIIGMGVVLPDNTTS